MRELTQFEVSDVSDVSGGRRNFFTVITGVIWGATFGAVLGIPGGPVGMIAGATTGAINGAAVAIAKEGAEGLREIQNGTEF